VILLGHSILIASLRASLQAGPHLHIESVDDRLPDAAERLLALDADLAIFDSTDGQPEFLVRLLKEWPDLVFIDVDPSSDRALVLLGLQPQVLYIEDLLRLIE
jgi:hypothetical protein